MLFISPKKLFLFSRYLNFCSDYFGHAEKRFDMKTKVNFKIYDTTNWETNHYSKHTVQHLYNMRNIVREKSYTKYGGETSPRRCAK